MKYKWVVLVAVLVILGGAVGVAISWSPKKHVRHDILIKARQYYYDPAEIEVDYNDTLHIKLVSMDVVHGFYLENYDIDAEVSPNVKTFKVRKPSEGYNWKDTTEMVFVANQKGKFRFRCSHTCGNMHPFMQGVLIVKPNRLFFAGMGMIIGLFIGLITLFYQRIYKS